VSDETKTYNDIPEEQRKKAKAFFDRGQTIAGTGNFDYAITMYLEGLKVDPEAVDQHQKLFDIALRRKASGMKKGDSSNYGAKGKEDYAGAMVAAESRHTFDPGNRDYQLAMMEAAVNGGYFDTAVWIGNLLNKSQLDSGKPDFNKYIKARDLYSRMRRYDLAVEACRRAFEIRPGDMDLANDLKNLSAEDAMLKGKYAGSFRDSIRDRVKQEDLMRGDEDSREDIYLNKQLKEAQAALAIEPSELGKITKLAQAYLKFETPEAIEKAKQTLMDGYHRTKQFRLKLGVSEIRLKQLRDESRKLAEMLKQDPANEDKKLLVFDFHKARLDEELAIYVEAGEQYPTENKFKYEMAFRLADLERHGDAIPLFQQIVSDPKYKQPATLQLGKSFLAAEFAEEAVETLRGLVESYQIQGDDFAKDIYYWFGRSLEANNDNPTAIKSYSQIARWDFGYKDVQVRIKRLRGLTPSA